MGVRVSDSYLSMQFPAHFIPSLISEVSQTFLHISLLGSGLRTELWGRNPISPPRPFAHSNPLENESGLRPYLFRDHQA